jgi:hypothetical protein
LQSTRFYLNHVANILGGFTVGQFIKQFGQNLWAELQTTLSAIGNFFTNYFSAAERIGNSIESLCTRVDALVLNTQKAIQEIKDFKFDPKWKTRVINVPIAIDQVRNFISKVPQELADKFKALAVDMRGLKDGLHAVAGQVSGEGGGGAGLIKVISWMSLLDQSFQRLQEFVDDLSTVVQDLRDITFEIEKLDTLFLQQGNPRVRLKKTISARSGKLHPE